MALLNYSTSIDVYKTLGEIQGALAKAGARNVSVDYDDGMPIGLGFTLSTPIGLRDFRLPMRHDAVWAELLRQRKAGKIQPRYATVDQAQRVGWRILKDWVEAQVAIVESGMTTLDQSMLAHMVNDDGFTVYQVLVDNHKMLPEGRPDGAG